MDFAYIGYLLFVVPGFFLVWTYRHFTNAEKIGEFEYAAWSFFFGVFLFIADIYILSINNKSLPPIPINNIADLLGSIIGISLGIVLGSSFLIGYIGAFISRMGLFRWVDKKLFKFLDWLEEIAHNFL